MPQLADWNLGNIYSGGTRTNWFRSMFASDTTPTGAVQPVQAITEPAGMVMANRHVTLELMPYGTGSDNATIIGTLYAITLLGGPPHIDGSNPINYFPESVLTFTATL